MSESQEILDIRKIMQLSEQNVPDVQNGDTLIPLIALALQNFEKRLEVVENQLRKFQSIR